MSIFSRLWSMIRRPTSLVGRDLEGNRFYEYPSTTDDPRRTKRFVKPIKQDDMIAHASGPRQIPVQWKAWMTHTRAEPPTLEELQLDLERQERTRRNAAIIDAQIREERLKLAELKKQQSISFPLSPLDELDGTNVTQENSADVTDGVESNPNQSAKQNRRSMMSKNRTLIPSAPLVETESWTPKIARRRS